MSLVLIAEDEKLTRKIAKGIVGGMGHIPILSPNGRHAFETLQSNNHIDLLITDIFMPEMDGRDLIKKVRAELKFKDFPIIAMSSLIGPNKISTILEGGADLFVCKPLQAKSFRNEISQILRQFSREN